MKSKERVRVAVLFGGKSGEHEVSLASARSIMAVMDRRKYEVFPVGISRSGRWLTRGDPMLLLTAGEGGLPDDECTSLVSSGGRELVPGTSESRFPAVDVVFPVLHGPFGEDGTVQGLLELADLPYVGAGVLGSALGMDKAAQKAVLRVNGLPVVEHLMIKRKAWRAHPEEVVADLEARFGYPLFVKPANLGSSLHQGHPAHDVCHAAAIGPRVPHHRRTYGSGDIGSPLQPRPGMGTGLPSQPARQSSRLRHKHPILIDRMPPTLIDYHQPPNTLVGHQDVGASTNHQDGDSICACALHQLAELS